MHQRRTKPDPNARVVHQDSTIQKNTPKQQRSHYASKNRFFIRVFILGFIGFSMFFLILSFSSPISSQKRSMRQTPLQPESQHDEESETLSVVSDQKQQYTLLLIMDIGTIKMRLRPDLSKESVDYVFSIAREGCKECTFYRAEKPGILQGKMINKAVSVPSTKGSCPIGLENVQNDCPEWDKNCACHGPIMTKGSVAWAAGGTGPDLFIDVYQRPAEWWGTQHTNFANIEDEDSFTVIEEIWKLPTKKSGGLNMLLNPIHYDVRII